MTDSTCCCVERPWHVKNRLALLNVATFILIFFSVLLGTSYASAQAAFVTQSTPWGAPDYANGMDAKFGAGNWTNATFSSVDVNALFANHDFIYLEGSDGSADELEAFLAANGTALENWVAAGNRLFLNSAPNEGDGMNFGFGGVALEYAGNNLSLTHTGSAEPFDASSAVWDGITTPSFTANYFGHALICPAGMVGHIHEVGDDTRVTVASMNYGSGYALFGGITYSGAWNPSSEAFDLYLNILGLAIDAETGGCEPELNIVCASDVSLECGSDITPDAIGYPSIESNDCVGDLEISFMDDMVSNDNCPLIIARTWIATDGEVTEMCTQTITLEDTTAPLIEADFTDIEVACSEVENNEEALASYAMELIGQPAIADCSSFDTNLEMSYSALDQCPIVGALDVVFTATDECGNASSFSFTISVSDTEGPVFDLEEEILVSCLEEVPAPADLVAFDLCSNEEIPADLFTSNNGELTDTCSLSTAFGPGDDWAFWLPTLSEDGFASSANYNFDANGGHFDQFNDGTAHIYGTVVNDINPNEAFELNIWLENKADWTTWSGLGRNYKDDLGCAQPDLYEDWTYYEMVNGFSTAVGLGDFAGDVLSLNHMPASYYFGFQIGMGANNKNCDYGISGWFTYEGFVDGQYINGHGDVNADASCGPVNEQDCPHNTEFTYLYRAVDACGNVTIAEQTIIVNDEIGPDFIDFPADITVSCDAYPVEIPVLSGVDNCEGEVIVVGPEDLMIPGDCPNEYIIERTWGAIDICGNRTDRTWTITIIDEEAPMFEGLPAAELTVECDMVPEAAEVSVSDNCSAIENIAFDYSEELIDGNCPGNYTIIREWIAVDECENENNFVQTINVQDTTAPTFNDYEYYTAVSCEEVDGYTLTASDNCGNATVEITFEQLNSGGCMGVLYREYTATDECGNEATVEQFITITDNVAPSLVNVPENNTLECSEVSMMENGNFFDQGDVFGEDNCALEVSIDYSEEMQDDGDDCENSYLIVRTWIGTDYCGNETMAQQTTTVVDTTAPEFVEFPGDLVVECSDELPAVVFPIAEDNCDDLVDVELTIEEEDGECDGEYTISRIFRGYDNCGNEVIGVQTIQVVDTTAPAFTFVPDAALYECDEEAELVMAEASDLCSEATLSYVDGQVFEGECANEFGFVRTFTATDACGNMTTAEQEIYFQDTTAPVFAAYDVEIDMPCDNIMATTVSAEDNCGDVEITYEDTFVSGGCAGRIIRDFTAVDACGNEATAQQISTLVDEVAPVWTLFPANVTVECDNVPSNDEIEVAFEDNCDNDVSLAYNGEVIIDGACEDSYTIERTWTITDQCGNATPATWTISVQDTTAPVFTEVAEDVTVECDQELPAPFAAAEDNCDAEVEISVEGEMIEGECANEYTMVRTYTAMDNCGNVATATQTISVVDTTAPVIAYQGGELTLECDQTVDLPEVTATDNCGEATVSMEMSMDNGECENERYEIYTWSAVDACGNVSESVSLYVYFQDTTAPVFNAYDVEIDMPCDNIMETTVSAEDNCGDVEITFEDTFVSGGCAGRIIRDFTAVDACGNAATAQQIITLVDEVAPVWTLFPTNVTVECDNVPSNDEIEVAFEDNCDDDVSLAYNGEVIIDGACEDSYTIERTWTITDQCGNATPATWTINVQDTTAPVFTEVAEDVTVECDQELPAPFAAAEDNCDAEVEISVEGEMIEGECANEYTMVRTYTAIDNCGNVATATQTITVVDTTAPEFTFVPEDLELECDLEVPAVNAEAADNCGDATVSFEDYYDYTPWMAASNGGDGVVDFSNLPNGFSIDGSDTGSGSEIFTVAMSAVKNVTLSFDWDYTTIDIDGAGLDPFVYFINDEAYVEISDNAGADNQSGSFSIDLEAGSSISLGIWAADDDLGLATVNVSNINFEVNDLECPVTDCFIRQFTAVDACGNSTIANQQVVIVDTTAPVFEAYDVEIDMPCDNITETTVSAMDNCSDVEITYEDTYVSGGCAGRIIRDFTAVDACGNSATAQQIITLVDEVAPVWTLFPADVTVECDNVPSNDGIEVAFEDNCDDELVLEYNGEAIIDGACEDSYTIERTWTITDQCGNATPATWTINVQDTTAPVLSLENEESTIECDQFISLPFVTAEDNCDADVSIVMEMESIDGDCANERTDIYTWTATDNCGNSDVAVWTVNVVDTTAPEFDAIPDSEELSCEDAIPSDMATASDNCGDATVSMVDTIIDGDCPQSYTIVRTWTATDACGNTNSTTTEYYIYDDVAPVFDQVLENVSVECADDVPAAPVVSATDNCGTVEVIVSTEVIEEDQCGNGISIVTYIATDECGNSAEMSYSITVLDNTAPELTGTPVANLVLDCEDEVPAPADVMAIDNCDSDITVEYSEEFFGDLPAEGSIADCVLSTPAAVNPDGTVCTGDEAWSLLLFEFDNADKVFYSTIEANFVQYPDGSATLSGSVVRNDDPTRGWNIDVTFENGMDWDMWSSQGFPTGYKDDCGLGADHFEDWTYYIMQAGATLTGWGGNAGSMLNLNHAPSSLYYGYQVGVGADNVNSSFGSGGWFTYSGMYNQQMVEGSGDFAFDHDCCPDYSIERTWCAVDCSGNETCFTQMISFDDLGIDPPMVNPIGNGEVIASKDDAQVSLLRLSPNPVIGNAKITFVVPNAADAKVEILNMNGQLVAELFNEKAEAGQSYELNFNAGDLPVGVYLYRLTSADEIITNRMIINK